MPGCMKDNSSASSHSPTWQYYSTREPAEEKEGLTAPKTAKTSHAQHHSGLHPHTDYKYLAGMQGRMCGDKQYRKKECRLFTCCRILFRQCHQCVAGTRLVVHQGFGRYIANDLIPLCWLHLHCDILQDLIIQGVRAVKLNRKGESSNSLKLLTTH